VASQVDAHNVSYFRKNDLDLQASNWVGQISQVLEVGESRIKAIVEILDSLVVCNPGSRGGFANFLPYDVRLLMIGVSVCPVS